ncbi:thiol:disulfide interchange protein DsbG [Salmonella enterica]|nr:thiol:disulfide interchange protein DsbG [Salmonella enterica]ECJ7923346.1 thiol:disulfide interchange protein DsbG [Salmonella enterica]EEU3775163.1 thiol:disulfide interchange protein DsbG [Salmonella enterica]EKA7159209.1 thiol:disulfide interchange protein DsbG [Salmonella enterica]
MHQIERLLLLVLGLLPTLALAETSPLPEPLAALEKQGLELKGEFTIKPDFKGYVMEYDGQGTTVFLSSDKKHAFVGNLVDSDGNNLSTPWIEKYVYAPMAREIWQKLEKSRWIQDGKDNAAQKVYVFFDPYCPYCTEFWQKARPWVDAGKVQLRLIPVAILRPDSNLKAAAIMMSKDPVKTLHDYESSHWKTRLDKPDPVPADITAALQDNLLLMEKLGSNATPAIYYLSPEGRLQQQLGLPPDDDTMNTIMGGKP